MAKINSETLLRGDYLLPQKCNTELENLALPNHLQLSLFVPLPLPTPGSAPDFHQCTNSDMSIVIHVDLSMSIDYKVSL